MWSQHLPADRRCQRRRLLFTRRAGALLWLLAANVSDPLRLRLHAMDVLGRHDDTSHRKIRKEETHAVWCLGLQHVLCCYSDWAWCRNEGCERRGCRLHLPLLLLLRHVLHGDRISLSIRDQR